MKIEQKIAEKRKLIAKMANRVPMQYEDSKEYIIIGSEWTFVGNAVNAIKCNLDTDVKKNSRLLM